ncbi:MAG: Asp-tRNA(Asn)/Glu-tRNA(Gln) amidotransferase subunit GatA [Balneolales bacterium]|nr:Asp-tRNA(Asn)/Glu-tRNA(Gln) amidotransferase subunit GatA [Balneolales bacterium]
MRPLSISQTRAKIKDGDSFADIISKYAEVIANKNPEINAFSQTYVDQALRQAAIVEDKIKAGTAGKLAGAVIGIKEAIVENGKVSTAGSKMLEGFESVYTATAVEKLLAEDAVLIGRTNMDEFAMGSSTENSAYGVVRNPHDTTRVPGGSSGGSAAAVAAGMCHATLGSDTGGSIRQPASLCGIVGLRPTYGRVSRYGLIAYASSFDSIGPMTANVEDAALMLEVLAGQDSRDATSSPVPVGNYSETVNDSVKGLRIGVPEEYFGEGMDAEVRELVELRMEQLKEAGCEFVSIKLPHTKYAVATYYILATAEASSNLARYDGIRYGHRADQKKIAEDLAAERKSLKDAGEDLAAIDSALVRLYKQSRTEGFGAEVKRRIMLGTYVLSSGYYDAYYAKAQKIRRLIQQDFNSAFSQCDVIISPTSPTVAFPLGEKTDDPLQMYLSDIYTISANLAGVPGISVPANEDFDKQLPVGIQFMAPHFKEESLFKAAAAVENLVR